MYSTVQYCPRGNTVQVTSTGTVVGVNIFKSLRHDVMTQDGRQTFQRGVNARMTVIWDVSIRMWLKPGLVWTKFQHSANLQHWSRAYNRVSVKIAAETHQSIFSSSLSRRVAGSNGWVHTPSIKPKKLLSGTYNIEPIDLIYSTRPYLTCESVELPRWSKRK